MLHQKTCHEIGDSHKEHSKATAHSFNADGIGKARFACSRRPEHDDVFGARNETAGHKIRLRKMFRPLKAREIIVFKYSRWIKMCSAKRSAKGFNFPVSFDRAEGTDDGLLFRFTEAKTADGRAQAKAGTETGEFGISFHGFYPVKVHCI